MKRLLDLDFWFQNFIKSPVAAVMTILLIGCVTLASAWQNAERRNDDIQRACQTEISNCEKRIGEKIETMEALHYEKYSRLYDRLIESEKQTQKIQRKIYKN